MKKNDFKSLSIQQLQDQLTAERAQLLKLNFAHSVSPIENPMRIRESRKQIARILTELTIKTKQAQVAA
jgi:large subunit ribosomal protein L29